MPTADEMISSAVHADLTGVLERAGSRPCPTLRATALDGLGFADRVRTLADAVRADLPAAYEAFAAVVRTGLDDERLTGWMVAPLAEAVAQVAVAAGGPAFEDGLELLAALTPRLTAEFALRRFLNADADRTLDVVRAWVHHPDEHVRRLASEGTRPHLPWGRAVPALADRPEATLALLDVLADDPSEYVRRSAANHLNDLARRHPELVVTTAAAWWARGTDTIRRTVRHALRTLVKRGDPGALAVLGFTAAPRVRVDGPVLGTASVAVGGRLPFTATVTNDGVDPMAVVLDYVVHHRKANGSTTAKVFKIGARTLAPGQTWTVDRRHSFAVITTRVYHPGPHAIGLQLNGVAQPPVAFELTAG